MPSVLWPVVRSSKGPVNSTAVSKRDSAVEETTLDGERPSNGGSRDSGALCIHSVAASGSHVMVHDAKLANRRHTMVDGLLRGVVISARGRTWAVVTRVERMMSTSAIDNKIGSVDFVFDMAKRIPSAIRKQLEVAANTPFQDCCANRPSIGTTKENMCYMRLRVSLIISVNPNPVNNKSPDAITAFSTF